MQELFKMIFTGENVRLMIILLGTVCAALWIDGRFEKKIHSIMDEKLESFYKKLKDNDFAHLNQTIMALTFILERNGLINGADKNHIDSHLDR